MAKTGNLGTISFGTSAFVASFTSIGAWEPEVGAIDDSHLLSSGFKTNFPDDLKDPGETSLECHFDPSVDLPTIGVPESITITYPHSLPFRTHATLVGTGYIKKGGTPELKNGQVMSQKLTIKWDGKTGPAFTKQAAASSGSVS